MLIDFVSDLRAPTPTGAAEFAVPVRAELQTRILTIQSRMFSSMTHYLNAQRKLVTGLGRGNPLSGLIASAFGLITSKTLLKDNAIT